jgi:hypothetical protein
MRGRRIGRRQRDEVMMNAFYDLPVVWMTVVVLGGFAVVDVLIHRIVFALATGKRALAFKAISPVMLTPLAVVFGLIVAFLAAQVWSDSERASGAVAREASALGTVMLLAKSFPEEMQARIGTLVRRHVEQAVNEEWPAMAHQEVTLSMITPADTDALKLALSMSPRTDAETVTQRELIVALRAAFDARRERIIISRFKINWVKWSVVHVLAFLILSTIALVHSDNRVGAGLAMALFSVAAGACIVLIAAHNRPFVGEISVGPELLVHALPTQ